MHLFTPPSKPIQSDLPGRADRAGAGVHGLADRARAVRDGQRRGARHGVRLAAVDDLGRERAEGRERCDDFGHVGCVAPGSG